MDAQEVRRWCLAQPEAVEERPFGPGALVLKVRGKIFAILGEDAEPPTVSLKCGPQLAEGLREAHVAVGPGYHLDKRHWNTVVLDGSVPEEDLRAWIEDSWDLVVAGLPKRVQAELRA